MAERNNLAIYKGETVVQPFQQIIQGTTTPVDITTWTIVCTVRRKSAGNVLLTPLVTITSSFQGLYNISLTHAQTLSLNAGVYVYDIQRTDGGSEAVLSIGSFTVQQEVLNP